MQTQDTLPTIEVPASDTPCGTGKGILSCIFEDFGLTQQQALLTLVRVAAQAMLEEEWTVKCLYRELDPM